MKRKHSETDGGRSKKEKKRDKSENHKKKKHKHKKRRRVSSGDVDRHDAIIGPIPSAKPEVSHVESTNSNSSKEVNKKLMMPMTKEQWEKEQNKISRVFDPETGRCRLVRGSGEVIEEIVSRGRQKEINKNATMADGLSYQRCGEALTKN